MFWNNLCHNFSVLDCAINSSIFHLQIKFWKTDVGRSTLREHSIIYNEATSCGNKGYQLHSTTKDVATGHIYNLWPFTNITAEIVALNAKYEGAASFPVRFTTKEGGKSLDFICGRQQMATLFSYNMIDRWQH